MIASIVKELLEGAVAYVFIDSVAERRRHGAGKTLTHGWEMAIVGFGALAMALAMSVSVLFWTDSVISDPADAPPLLILASLFGLGSACLLLEYFVVKGKYDDVGIRFRTPWRGRTEAAWSDLHSVRFSSISKWYVLKFAGGKTIRVSTFIDGHGDLIRWIAKRKTTPKHVRRACQRLSE